MSVKGAKPSITVLYDADEERVRTEALAAGKRFLRQTEPRTSSR